MIPCLTPQSMRTTVFRACGLVMRISGVVTSATRSRALGSGATRASRRSRATLSGPSAAARSPGMTPWTRSFLVRARVSMPEIPGTPFSRSQSSRVFTDDSWDGWQQSSETT